MHGNLQAHSSELTLSHFQFLALVVHLKCGRIPKGVAWETASANHTAKQLFVCFLQAYYKVFLRHTENKTSHLKWI